MASGPHRTTRVEIHDERGVFMISVAAQLADMHPQTLRMYEARGLINPERSPKGTRLYSQRDVERLRRIQQMTAELGLNLAGVEKVLELETELAKARRHVRALESHADDLRAEIARLRSELGQRPSARVRPGTELVRIRVQRPGAQ